MTTLAEAGAAAVRRCLAADGLWLDVGAACVRVQGNAPGLADQLARAYAQFPLDSGGAWADLHVRMARVTGLRRYLRPQVMLRSDGQHPFEPFPADTALPLLEWGCNWLIGQRLNDVLLLHAGAVERDGLALLLPALPGSGKSTLTAALSLRGWRLLSDEFGTVDPATGRVRPMLKPVALKNQSIDVIRAFEPGARFGPEFPKTRKGRVAHLAALPDAVARRHQSAAPAAVILPRWQAGSSTLLAPLDEQTLFPALAFNAFNYGVLGGDGFKTAVHLVRRCLGWQLTYSDLDDAVRALDTLWPRVREHAAARASQHVDELLDEPSNGRDPAVTAAPGRLPLAAAG